MLEPGTNIGGYRVDSFLAQGGMGVVYRATQVALDRPVALKLIAPELARDPAFRGRFERESRLAAAIEHPNVIPVYEAGEADGQLFISMRFVPGTDLHTEISRASAAGAGMDPQRAARIVGQVGEALDAAHARGLVHRDVKPANVLIAQGDHAYLTDFGLVKDLGSDGRMTSTGTWVGTPDYVAPEQFKGDVVDARTDVYALGCVLYHALSGQVPFPRSQTVAKMWAHAEEPPPVLDGPLAVFNPVVGRGMAKDPAARFPSAGDLGRAAVAAAEGRPVSSGERTVARGQAAPTRPSPDDATAVRARPDSTRPADAPRRRRLAIAGGGAALLVAGGAAIAVALGGDSGGDRGSSPKAAASRPASASSARGPVVQSQTKIGGQIRSVAAGGGGVFTIDQGGRLVRVDAAGGKKTSETRLRHFGGDVTFGFGSIWASSRATKEGPGELQRIDPETARRSGPAVKVGKRPLGIAPGRQVLWVSNASSNTVLRVDPRKPRVVGRPLKIADGPFGIAARGATVWVTQFGNGTEKNRGGGAVRIVAPFDPLNPGDQPTAYPPEQVGDNPLAVAYGGRYVWAVSSFGKLVRIDEKTGETLSTAVKGFGGFSSVAGDAKRVWVAGVNSGAKRMIVARLDPGTARPIGKPADIGPGGGGRLSDLALSDGVLWASAGDSLYRLKP